MVDNVTEIVTKISQKCYKFSQKYDNQYGKKSILYIKFHFPDKSEKAQFLIFVKICFTEKKKKNPYVLPQIFTQTFENTTRFIELDKKYVYKYEKICESKKRENMIQKHNNNKN